MTPTRSASLLGLAAALLGACGDSNPPADASVTVDATPSDGGASPMAVEAVLRMCRTVHACGYTTARFGIPSDVCTERALGLIAQRAETDSPEQRVKYARMAQCAGTATSCDAFVRCVEFDTPCSGSATPMCAGTVAVRCSTPGGNYLPRIFDCATVGQTCMNGVCVLPAGANECMTAGGARCDGNVRVWCRPRAGGGNGEVREPCAAGAICVASSSDATCVPATPCTTEAIRCEGDTVVLCRAQNVGGASMMLETRTDCASIGRRCATNARGAAVCVPRATGCMIPQPNAASGSTCNGNSISVCLEGNPTQIDCTALGRTTCTRVMPPAGLGAPYAGCM